MSESVTEAPAGDTGEVGTVQGATAESVAAENAEAETALAGIMQSHDVLPGITLLRPRSCKH